MALRAALVAALVCAACAAPDAEPAVDLAACPAGDAAWSDAIDDARRDDAMAALETRAGTLLAACPGAWQPLWLRAEAIFRGGGRARMEEALAAYTAAHDASVALDDPVGVARTGIRLGWLLDAAGESGPSAAAYDAALGAAREAGRDDLAGFVHANRVAWFERRGRLAEADAEAERAAAALAAAGRADEATALRFNRALQLQSRGNLVGSSAMLEEILARAVADGDAGRAARCRLALGLHETLVGRPDAARTRYEAIPADDAEHRPFAELGLGRLALDAGRPDEALARLDAVAESGVAEITRLRAAALGADALLRLGRRADAEARLADVLTRAEQAGLEPPAYLALSLLGRAALDDGDAAGAIEPLRRAVERIEAQGAGAEDLGYLRERLQPYVDLAAAYAATNRIDDAFATIELAHARGLRRAGGGAIPAPLAAVRAGLRQREAVLDLLIGDTRGVAVLVTPSRVQAVVTPGWGELRPAVVRWRAALLRPLVSSEARRDPLADLARDRDAGLLVGETLLAPFAGALETVNRLWIVPDQDLSLIPFAAVPLAAGGYLGDRIETAVLPLAGPPPVPLAAGRVLLAGDPLPDAAGRYPRLPLAAAELERVADVWGDRVETRLGGAALTRERLLGSGLERFGTIHLATHADASSLDPSRCAVVLSGGERLGLGDVATLSLSPALVVLSACRTGEGEVVPGEGVVGLTWAFLRAGATAVAASLWSVEDESTAELMTAFHERLRAGDDAVTALAVARRRVAARRGHPAYWAPFVVVAAPAPPPR